MQTKYYKLEFFFLKSRNTCIKLYFVYTFLRMLDFQDGQKN